MTSTHGDAVLLATAVLLGLVVLAVAVAASAVRRVVLSRRPVLPAEDRPPAGLGRLVPVGEQVDAEVRRGLRALEVWLLDARRA